VQQAIGWAARFGNVPILRFARAQRPGLLYRVGRWDEALSAAQAFLEEETGAAYAEASALDIRALIRSARSEHESAREDAARALATARSAGDPQTLYPALAISTVVAAAAGDNERAKPFALELLADEAGSPDFPYGGPGEVVAVLIDLVGPEYVRRRILMSARLFTPWAEGAGALFDGDLERAAEIYQRAGAATDVAFVRLRLARRLVEEGRRAEADVHLQQALAFYRSVGASRYVRDGEELLAATA
jgi:tetratricopeptide (TPR) repeat protein